MYCSSTTKTSKLLSNCSRLLRTCISNLSGIKHSHMRMESSPMYVYFIDTSRHCPVCHVRGGRCGNEPFFNTVLRSATIEPFFVPNQNSLRCANQLSICIILCTSKSNKIHSKTHWLDSIVLSSRSRHTRRSSRRPFARKTLKQSRMQLFPQNSRRRTSMTPTTTTMFRSFEGNLFY